MDISIVEDFRLSRPVGRLMTKDELCQKKYITQILNQLKIGHKLGFVHRDIRIYNLILFDDYAYLIDWNSSTYNGFNGRYEGTFMTASTPVLNEYELSLGEQVSAYYADDYISVIYMLLLCSCTKQEQEQLKAFAHYSMTGIFTIEREIVLRQHAKEIIDLLCKMEE